MLVVTAACRPSAPAIATTACSSTPVLVMLPTAWIELWATDRELREPVPVDTHVERGASTEAGVEHAGGASAPIAQPTSAVASRIVPRSPRCSSWSSTSNCGR